MHYPLNVNEYFNESDLQHLKIAKLLNIILNAVPKQISKISNIASKIKNEKIIKTTSSLITFYYQNVIFHIPNVRLL